MRAAICREYGPPESVRVEDVAAPELRAGQVRVRVTAAAVNFPDVLLVANRYQVPVPTPFIPGSEFAGEVVELGEGVDGLPVGQRVFGTAMVGAFAEEIAVPARSVTATPDGVDDGHAAAFGVVYRTAFHTLRSIAGVQPGEAVVVLGAGGGVGSAAVQLGAALGATVTAVASSAEKLAAARALGAHHLVNHRSGPVRESLRAVLPDGADVVVDPVGGDLSEAALRSLRWGGRFVTVGFAAGIPRIPLNLVLLKGVQVLGFEMAGFARNHAEEIARNEEELKELLTSGRALPHIGARFSLDDTAAALRHVGDGRAVGKVVIEVAQ